MQKAITLPATFKKQTAERVIEIRIPSVPEPLKKNRLFGAFYTVLSAPVK